MESLDVFDTAIYRDVYEPTDIFTLIEYKVGKNFKKRRIQAEKQAREKYKFPNLKQIYEFIPEFNLQTEIDYELEHCYANSTILEIYNNNPSKYVFISDMYLSSNTLIQILKKCGFENPRVYVSCEQKANKGSGLLFKKVIQKVGHLDKHYGDNYNSDIEGAKLQNIETVYLPALHKKNIDLPAIKNPLLKKYIAEIEDSHASPIEKLAKYYAPLIYEFTRWVVNSRVKNQDIFFLSRDMFIPFVVAKTFMKARKINYLYCSRRSLAPLFLNSGEKALKEKMNIILTKQEKDEKKGDIKEVLRFLKSCGLKTNDIIADVGYSGSTQRILERYLKIKLQGMYMQLDKVPEYKSKMNMTMFLRRFALIYRFLCEFVLTSPEDCIEGYKAGHIILKPDNPKRKQYARLICDILLNKKLFDRITNMRLDVFDIEQTIIHLQQNPDRELLELFNEPILQNRSECERGVNFDREAIKNGKLIDCYYKSYARPWFRKMLEQDEELHSLVKLLPF